MHPNQFKISILNLDELYRSKLVNRNEKREKFIGDGIISEETLIKIQCDLVNISKHTMKT